MLRRWGLLAALAPIGVASLLYVVIVRGFVDSAGDHHLGWPLLGVLPTLVFGLWLLTVSSARSAVFIAVAATSMAVGSACETIVLTNVGLIQEPWFPLFSMIGLTADAVSTAAFLAMFATYPTGTLERRWQRIAVALIWVPVAVGPLTLLTTPTSLCSHTSASAATPFRISLRCPGSNGLPRRCTTLSTSRGRALCWGSACSTPERSSAIRRYVHACGS